MKEKHFDIRAFVTCMLLLSFIGLPITGYIPHLIPRGGDRTIPHLLMAMHNVLGIMFIITGTIHLGYNYRGIKSGIVSGSGSFPFFSRETIAAVLASIAITVLFSFHTLIF